MPENKKIPAHVAIIMDGNGRWARERGEERSFGHRNGVESVRQAIEGAIRNGVKWLTLYAFSTENWNRPKEEIDTLMELLCKCAAEEVDSLCEQGVRVRIIGAKDGMSKQVLESLEQTVLKTEAGKVLTVVLAINYSSRSELTDAVGRIATKVAQGELKVEDIDADTVSGALYTAGIPDPDLIIRTSGEYRLSNFLLWQAAYSEFYFTDTLWPDFTQETFNEALASYGKRERRYGKVTCKA